MDISGQLQTPIAVNPRQVSSIAIVYMLSGFGDSLSGCTALLIQMRYRTNIRHCQRKTHHNNKTKLIELNVYFDLTIKLRNCMAGLVSSRVCVHRRIRTTVQSLPKIIVRFIGPLIHCPLKGKAIPLEN